MGPTFFSSLSFSFPSLPCLTISLLSLSPSARDLCLQTHGWQSMAIQITNPLSKSQTLGWFVTDPKSTTNHHRGGPRRANRGGPRRATALWPLTQFEPTHSHTCDLKPPTTIHGDLNPPTVIWTHPPMASHNHHRPIAIWIPRQSKAYKPILRERRSFHCERKRGESGMGLLVGLLVAAMVEVFFLFLFFFFFLLWLVTVSGCGCGGFFLLWFFFSFFVSGGCGMGGGFLVGGW